jgi:protease I
MGDEGLGRPVKVDRNLAEAFLDDYDALVLPGGQINPDLLRINQDALAFITGFFKAKKVIGAICHAPWLLIETGIAKGRAMTGYKSILTDLRNAGAKVRENDGVVADRGIVTSRNLGDLEAFSAKLIEEIAEGRRQQHAA